jgi:hypothetical protein
MDLFERWQKSCALLTHSMNVLRAYPVLFVPVIAVWIVFAPAYLYPPMGTRIPPLMATSNSPTPKG